MKLPRTFLPEKDLDVKSEELRDYKEKKASVGLHDLIKNYMDFADFSKEKEHTNCVKLDFKDRTEMTLEYENISMWYKNLRRLENTNFGLSYVEIKTVTEDLPGIINATFSENPLGYKSLPFDRIEFTLEKDTLLDKNKASNAHLVEKHYLTVDRLYIRCEDKADHYLINLSSR
ncbi:hypothetical protein FJZ53_02975 [Candidatus Woesearchaeota archaeon]|nr:hypothetical protein [Candidatus Woesearchaeota archaeon]